MYYAFASRYLKYTIVRFLVNRATRPYSDESMQVNELKKTQQDIAEKRHRAPGLNDLPPALFKDGGEVLSQHLSDLFASIWEKESAQTTEENDIDLILEEDEAQVLFDELTKVTLSFDMHFAPTKCKAMLLVMQSLNPPLTIQGEVLEVVERFTYLGSCNVIDELDAQICKARAAFANLRRPWRQNGLSLNLKGQALYASSSGRARVYAKFFPEFTKFSGVKQGESITLIQLHLTESSDSPNAYAFILALPNGSNRRETNLPYRKSIPECLPMHLLYSK
ncbi:hypothetical protein T265_02826 [Opisthorchis viverrini]|uniref:Uncharacterized protein n=1 Tax=Opisthorchis viverrini TaxID=6198 RepID=A0A075AI03_OPIVI|nr:hypothetical protein T265_02826 [Opisthorchis viverrini]KER30784.1 hypothetical protein T265_02826 [Opisthorchis viverrini]